MNLMNLMNTPAKGKGKGTVGGVMPKKPAQMKPGDWKCPSCGDHQFAKNTTCRQCGVAKQMAESIHGMKPGDWSCPKCNDFQFANNTECRQCGVANPNPEGSKAARDAALASGFGGQTEKPGDWYCPACGDLQFAKNVKCRKCGTANPDPETSAALSSSNGNGIIEKPGDWYCPGCNDLQFAKNAKCRKCGTPNPDPKACMEIAKANGMSSGRSAEMKPGDWYCTACGDLQFAKNAQCRKCGTANFAAMVTMMAAAGDGGGSTDMMGGMPQLGQSQQLGQLEQLATTLGMAQLQQQLLGNQNQSSSSSTPNSFAGSGNQWTSNQGNQNQGIQNQGNQGNQWNSNQNNQWNSNNQNKRKMCPTFMMLGVCEYGDSCYDAHM